MGRRKEKAAGRGHSTASQVQFRIIYTSHDFQLCVKPVKLLPMGNTRNTLNSLEGKVSVNTK